MVGKLRTVIGIAALSLMLCQPASAGVVCEAIGKCWDKAAGKLVKCHKACQEHLKQGLHHKCKGKGKPHRHGHR